MAVDYEGFVGGDRISTELPELQQRLLKAIHASGKPIVMVNMSGSAVALPWADANLNAVLQAWYPGQAGGTAVADVITGKDTPAGRLPLTFYRTTDICRNSMTTQGGRTYKYFRRQLL
jgi:beta-glucosidase